MKNRIYLDEKEMNQTLDLLNGGFGEQLGVKSVSTPQPMKGWQGVFYVHVEGNERIKDDFEGFCKMLCDALWFAHEVEYWVVNARDGEKRDGKIVSSIESEII